MKYLKIIASPTLKPRFLTQLYDSRFFVFADVTRRVRSRDNYKRFYWLLWTRGIMETKNASAQGILEVNSSFEADFEAI